MTTTTKTVIGAAAIVGAFILYKGSKAGGGKGNFLDNILPAKAGAAAATPGSANAQPGWLGAVGQLWQGGNSIWDSLGHASGGGSGSYNGGKGTDDTGSWDGSGSSGYDSTKDPNSADWGAEWQ